MDKEYIEVTDNSFHHYVIPYDERESWYKFCAIPEDDERSWEVPEYAVRVDGGDVIFKDYRIG
jgi:hypothetical protein